MLHRPVVFGISAEPKDDGLEQCWSSASSFLSLPGRGKSHVLRSRPEGDREGSRCGGAVSRRSAPAGVQGAPGRRVVLNPTDLVLLALGAGISAGQQCLSAGGSKSLWMSSSSRGQDSSGYVHVYPQAPHQPLLTTWSLKGRGR